MRREVWERVGILLVVAEIACVYPRLHEGKTRQQWVALLKSPDQKMRADAAFTLGWYFCPAAAPEILPYLSHEQAATRSAAADALGMCRDGATGIIAALERLRMDQDEVVRIDAALAISRLECPKGQAARVLPDLIVGLKNPRRTYYVAMWLWSVGPAAEPAVPGLIEALSSAEGDTRLVVPMALGSIGKGARPALPRLREVLASDPDPDVRKNIENAIENIEHATERQEVGALASIVEHVTGRRSGCR
jgi:HEAT repeat protein